ncbi:MAG TPA: 50S ribosomal protein L11 methyltransferase [Acidimicrobiales bacterium]
MAPIVPAQLWVEVEPTSVDAVSGALWGLGTGGIEERAHGHGVLLVAGFDDRPAAEAAGRGLADAAEDDRLPRLLAVEVVDVADDAWLDTWRAHARVERGGPFVVVPAWLEAPDADPGDVMLRVDPGRAFGSGSHPTTRLVLAELARVVEPGDAVLDVGCGSGVLAVAAALIGATPVWAIDIDSAAVSATAANAQANGVGDVVHPTADPIDSVPGPFPVVLANLLAPVITELADQLRAQVALDGALVLSGLLADRWPASAALFGDWPVESVLEDDGWVAVTLRRPPLIGPS